MSLSIRSLHLLGAAVLSLGVVGAARAHHSFAAEFDGRKPVTVQGSVTKVQIVNPHSWLYLDVKNPDGTTTNWGFEFGSPGALKAKGLTKDKIPAGTHVKVDGYRARNGGPFGYSRQVTLADGTVYQTGGAVDAPKAR